MIKRKFKLPYLADGTLDLPLWLEEIQSKYALESIDLLKKASQLGLNVSKGLTTFYGQPCLEHGLEMAGIVLDLTLDPTLAASAILVGVSQHNHLAPELITDQVGAEVEHLVAATQKLQGLPLNLDRSRNQLQIDRMRKMLLAMVSDIRVVLIKLAERVSIMRGIKNINHAQRKRIAQETMDIYAPLANRLGIGQIKWELEDLAFHYNNPDTYKSIATFLAERRSDRELHIHETISRLKEGLRTANIEAKISGRAKHIYSIFLKMQDKNVDLNNIYDYSAVRILVPTLQDCYTALSVVHSFWDHIPEEFDDYISHPKPNGYRSIHTAVIGPNKKNMEIQIRTIAMHEEAEHGVAAHWLYKEKKANLSGYETKITFLRQLLAWQKDLTKQDKQQLDQTPSQPVIDNRVYVFTPEGDVQDLPLQATPLDFAYHIHSEVGNRCKGAKVNGHIVQLTYQLKTGDQVEILTALNGTPSRDWLSQTAGYLKTSRARAKVMHWFKVQEMAKESATHKEPHEHEPVRPVEKLLTIAEKKQHLPPDFQVAGIDDVLTRIAKCCKPIPGDSIIGFITQGRGVTIHREDCSNIRRVNATNHDRLIQVSWDSKHAHAYYVDIRILAQGRGNLLKEITAILINAKVDLLALNSTLNKKNNTLVITATIQTRDIKHLNLLIQELNQVPNILDVKRLSE